MSTNPILTAETSTPYVQPGVELACWAAALLAIAMIPIFAFRYPGFQDYPNHLARGFILLNETDPWLSRLYQVQWSPLPNLGWDLWAITMGRVLDLQWTGKLYLAISDVSIVLGCFTLNRALVGRWTFAPLLSLPFLFSSAFLFGFLNFELSVGCSLLAAAWWISADEKRWLRRLLLATLFSTPLYFIHFYGWAFYGLFLLGYELHFIRKSNAWVRLLRLLRDGTQCIPVLVVMTWTAMTQPQPALTLQGFKPPYLRLSEIAHLIDVGHPIWNAAILALLGLFIFELLRRRLVFFHKELSWPISISVIVFFLMPDQIGDTFYVSWRLLFMAVLVSVASCEPSAKGNTRFLSTAIALMIAGLIGVQWRSWQNSERGTEDFIKIVQNVPLGSKLFVVHSGMTSQRLASQALGLYHVGAYAVITRQALVQSMFTLIGQQVLRFRDPVIQSAPRGSAAMLSDAKRALWEHDIDIAGYLQNFDFVVVHGPDSGDDLDALQTHGLTLVDSLQDFRLYKVLKSS